LRLYRYIHPNEKKLPTPIHTSPASKDESQFVPLKNIKITLAGSIKQSIFALAKRNTQSEKRSEHAANTEKTTKKVF